MTGKQYEGKKQTEKAKNINTETKTHEKRQAVMEGVDE